VTLDLNEKVTDNKSK